MFHKMRTVEKTEIKDFASVKLKIDDDKDNVIPVLIFSVKSENEATDAQWQHVQQIVDKYYASKQNCRIIIDLSKTTMIFSLPYIKNWSEFFKTNRYYLKEHVSYVAFVSDNTLMKNMLKVAINITPSKIPFYVAETKKEAYDL